MNATLLVTSCELKMAGMKRMSTDMGVRSCLLPRRKKSRRFVSLETLPSKVRWKTVVEVESDVVSLSSDESSIEESEESKSSTVAKNEIWYSKEEYKQMLLDQSLTVHIMRSLRSLAGETVAIDYCDENDSDSSRFDELIKKHQIDPKEYCERGLESYLSEERRNEVNAVRKLHKLLVIGEHVRQGMLGGGTNPELVRNASLNQSRKSSARAQKLALVDQRGERSSSADTKNKSNGDQRQDTQLHQSHNQHTNIVRIWSQSPSSSELGRNLTVKDTDMTLRNPCGNSLDHIHPNEACVVSERIRDTIMKQQQLRFLLQQEHEQNQRAQSQSHLQHINTNSIVIPDEATMVKSILASLQMQEQERLLHQNHQHRQQLQIRNYQVQRLLMLQQQQNQYESIQIASAAILGQRHR